MFLGVIDGFSEVVQWKIPDFFLLDEVKHRRIDSPPFSLAGCTWNLEVHPKGFKVSRYVSAFLRMEDENTLSKTLTFSIGIKTENGIAKERTIARKHTFKKGDASWGWPNFLDLDDLEECKSELAPSGDLTFTCRVECEAPILEEVVEKPEKVESQQAMLVELETLSSDFKDLLISQRKWDVTVSVQGRDFRAHRSVLSSRSSVFRAMYEHDTTEDETGVLTIPDCDPESFGEFLNFLYTGKVEEVSFQKAYHLYATSHKYDVQQLNSFCAEYLRQNLTARNVCEVVVMADRYGNDKLMSSAEEFFNENFCSILPTSEWTVMMKNNPRLADKLLKEMASAVSKNKSLKMEASSSTSP